MRDDGDPEDVAMDACSQFRGQARTSPHLVAENTLTKSTPLLLVKTTLAQGTLLATLPISGSEVATTV